MPGSSWVHRRVQRVSYEEPGLQRMQVSIDFTVPDQPIGTHLPISVLPKWPPLYRLDFRDAVGQPVPLLTTEQNGDIDKALLEALVTEISPTSFQIPGFHAALNSLTCGPETDLVPSFEVFAEGLFVAEYEAKAERLVEIAALLTDTTLLWYPVVGLASGQRTVAKIEYLIRDETAHRLLGRIGRSLSWHQPAEYIRLWHAGADANYHADVEAPPGLITREVEVGYLRYLPSWVDPTEVDGQEEEATERAEKRGVRPDQNLDFSGRLAHLYVTGRRPMAVDLEIRFAPTRTGVVLSSLLASVLIAILVTLFYCWRDWVSKPEYIDSAVAILILVPALIGYLVVRTTDHPMIRRYIVGIQLVSAAAAAVPLAMAVTLVRYAGEGDCLEHLWCWCVGLSWLFVAILFGGLLGAGNGIGLRAGEDEDEH